MGDSPIEVIKRLRKYVDELIDARGKNNDLAIKGRTKMILTALDKLRDAHKNSKLSGELIARIQDEKMRAELILPDTSDDYINFCWDCYRRLGIHVTVDKKVDSVCNSCGWVQCPNCGACRDPKYGGCKDRVYLQPKKEVPKEDIPF